MTGIDWTPKPHAITGDDGWYQDTDECTYIAEGLVRAIPSHEDRTGIRTIVGELPVTDWKHELVALKGQRVRVVARIYGGMAPEFVPEVISIHPIEG